MINLLVKVNPNVVTWVEENHRKFFVDAFASQHCNVVYDRMIACGHHSK